jgi:hypothetical protein
VIPKLLFTEIAHSTLIVPACQACQVGKGRGEQNLWKLVNIDIEGELHPVAAANFPAILRDELRIQNDLNRLGPLARAVASPSIVERNTESGLFAGYAVGADWRLEPAINTLRYSVRGLYYHRFGRMLDPYAPVEVAYIPDVERALAGSLLKRMPTEAPTYMPTLETGASELVIIPESADEAQAPIIVPDAVAVIVPFTAESEDEPAAFWGLVFNRNVTFLAGTENYAAVVRNIHRFLNKPDD